ncbi:MAG TPA: geranylgeranylglycerol-phosphate geranylgeranyltransferase [Chitinophagaceae bacterium]|nr:geranylgeranylglycerol-phosphate geranylgeranyltransferase [Chitinophagaceae bacterium]
MLKLIAAFFRLIRWPNLVFIMLTQLLFVYCIIMPVYAKAGMVPIIFGWHFVLLCLSSVLIAAAGYIINDYFDLNIDLVNKPEKMVVDKIIHRRWTIVWHLILSVTGIAIGFYLDITTRIFLLGVSNCICVILLFVYSISLKKKFLIGNVIISLLTAWVILVITWCENNNIINIHNNFRAEKIIRETFLFAGFAFIISLVREVVKDMEDIEGDRKYGCRTMPIIWGINATKVFVAVWLIVLIAVLVIVQVYAARLQWWLSIIYCLVFIIAPLLWIFKKLYDARTSKQFHSLSSLIKLVMLTGILSMIFFKYYH